MIFQIQKLEAKCNKSVEYFFGKDEILVNNFDLKA